MYSGKGVSVMVRGFVSCCFVCELSDSALPAYDLFLGFLCILKKNKSVIFGVCSQVSLLWVSVS